MTARSITRTFEIACLALGAALIMLYFSARAFAGYERREAIQIFAQVRSPVISELALRRHLSDRTPDQSLWSVARRQHYAAQLAETADSPAIPAAVLRIPSVQLEVPVYADENERNLNRGAVLVAGTALPDSDGNVAIAAHRDGYFRVLEKVAVDDVIIIDSLSGSRQYRVTALSIVAPTDTSVLGRTEGATITLITCYPFYFIGSAPQRYIVRAVAVS